MSTVQISLNFQVEDLISGWLNVDADMLKEHVGNTGWLCDLLIPEKDDNYLAMLAKAP